MGSCVNKSSNEIIEFRLNKRNEDDPTCSKSKKNAFENKCSLDFNSKNRCKKKVSIPALYSNNISKILIIPEFNDKNNCNSFREIIELFD